MKALAKDEDFNYTESSCDANTLTARSYVALSASLSYNLTILLDEKLMTRTPSHEISFRVRYAETDQMGIVHHSSYFVWFEEARSDFMRASGSSYAEFERAGLLLPLSEASARFLAPARYVSPPKGCPCARPASCTCAGRKPAAT